MGPLALLALLTGSLFLGAASGGGETAEPEPDMPDEPDLPDIPDEPGEPDIGAAFDIDPTTGTVEIDVGEDETRSLATIIYFNSQDLGSGEDFVESYEARFYLVPEDVDWSDASWETQGEIPGTPDPSEAASGYELEDFEETFGLELIGTVPLEYEFTMLEGGGAVGGSPVPDQGEMADVLPAIESNQPFDLYYLEANTDGDDLITFLPEDFVETRNGVTQVSVTQNAAGTDGVDWISAEQEGITVSGESGDDILETENDNVTLDGGAGSDTIMSTGDQTAINGGNGDDVIRADAASINGGDGDDDIYAETGTVLGGNGNDSVIVTAGTAEGGDGDDSLTGGGNGQAALFGQAGNDNMSIRGVASEAYGGTGDDFIGVDNDALGFGGDGNDTLQLSSGATGSGGDGDDLITVWNRLGDEDGPATATGGAGSDTFDVLVRNALNGEADDVFLHISDFDVTEDVLQVDAWELSSEVSDVEIIEADDGTYTDVRVTFTGIPALGPGIAIIRLDGTPGITADNVVINM